MAVDPKLLEALKKDVATAQGEAIDMPITEVMEETGPSAARSAARGFVEGDSDITMGADILQSYVPGLYNTGDESLDAALQGSMLTGAERRKAVNQVTQAQIDNEYWDTPPEGMAYFAGSMTKALATPTTLMPLGKGFSKATMIGAGLGMEYELLKGWKEGEMDLGDIATATAIGGISAGVFASIFGPKAATQARLTAELGGEATDVGESAIAATSRQASRNVDMPTAAARISPESYLADVKLQNALGERTATREFDNFMYRVGKADEYLAAPDKKGWKFRNPEVNKMLDEPKDAFHTLKSQMFDDKASRLALISEKELAVAAKGGKRGKRLVGEEYDKRINELGARVEADREILTRGFQDVVPPRSKLWTDIVAASSRTGDGFTVANLPDNLKAQRIIERGELPVNDKVAMKLDPPEGKMSELDAMLDGEVPAPNTFERMLNKLGGSKYFRRPTAEMSQTSVSGKLIADGLEEGFVQTNAQVAESIYQFRRATRMKGIDPGTVEEKQVVGLLNKTVNPKGLSPDVIQAAEDIKAQLTGVLDDAYKTGVIDQATYKALKKKGAEKGYFPRVYDEDLLNSPEGREQFAEALSAVKFKPEDADLLARTILRDNDKAVEKFVKEGVKGEGGIRFNKDSLVRLLKERGKTLDDKRSSHLEKPRKLPEGLEKILDPFLIRDAEGVLSKYFQDVHNRIEHARIFGAGDEKFEKLYLDLKGRNREVADRAWETYMTAVRASESQTLQSFVKEPESIRRAIGSLKSFETLKLIFAQSINLGQGVVNGTTYLAGRKGINPAESYKIALDSIADTARRTKGGVDLKEFADRSGATLQNVIMEATGDMNQAFHTIAGRELIAPLDLFNNPTKFLKSTGFFHVENMNRKMGAMMGKNYVETLAEKRIKLLSKGNGKKFQQQLAEVDEGLAELGIKPTFTTMDGLTMNDRMRAAQLFSNSINFTNAAHNMPLATQSLFGKLMFQFKSFAYHHGVFIAENVMKPAKQGNLAPLATYLGVGTPIGMGLDEFRRMIMADDKEFTMTERTVRGVSSVGGLGIMLDFLRGLQYGPEKAIAFVAGPGISDISRLGFGAAQTVSQSLDKGTPELKPLGKEVASSFVFPYKKQLLKSISEDRASFQNPYKNPYK